MNCLKGHWTTVTIAVLSSALLFGGLSAALSKSAVAEENERKVKSGPPPVYPELARKMNISGTVKVEVVIDGAGVVKSAKAIGGHPLLIPSAVEAAKKRRYEPAGGETTQVIEFRFSSGS